MIHYTFHNHDHASLIELGEALPCNRPQYSNVLTLQLNSEVCGIAVRGYLLIALHHLFHKDTCISSQMNHSSSFEMSHEFLN